MSGELKAEWKNAISETLDKLFIAIGFMFVFVIQIFIMSQTLSESVKWEFATALWGHNPYDIIPLVLILWVIHPFIATAIKTYRHDSSNKTGEQ